MSEIFCMSINLKKRKWYRDITATETRGHGHSLRVSEKLAC